MKPFLIGQNLWRFVDDSHPTPPESLETTPGQPKIPNPDYLVWLRTDQTLLSLLIATLSESNLGHDRRPYHLYGSLDLFGMPFLSAITAPFPTISSMPNHFPILLLPLVTRSPMKI